MVRFTTKIQQFQEMGEKTGWTYISIPAALAGQLLPGNRKGFRVKGKLDDQVIKGLALLPMGEGNFILTLNATIRKAIRKKKGDSLSVQLELDKTKIVPPKDLLDCLADEPTAIEYFKSLPLSHQNYFGNWIKSAKTEVTRTKRITRVINAMLKKQDYGQMIRAQRDDDALLSKR